MDDYGQTPEDDELRNEGLEDAGYQDDGLEDDPYPDDGFRSSEYRSDGYQDDAQRDGAVQDGAYQNDTYQGSAYQSGGYQGGAYQGSEPREDDAAGDDEPVSGGFDPSAFGHGGNAYGTYESGEPKRRGVPVWVFVLVLVCCLVGGGLIGRFVLTPNYQYITGQTSLTEQELDSVVGSWVSGGVYHEITAREAIETTLSLDGALQQDGTYAMPSADSILNAARNSILNDAVAENGIEVTDADMEAYAQETLGTTDYATLAQQYGMSEDQVQDMIRESAGVQKLYEQKSGTGEAAEPPTAPTAPAEGQEDTPNAEYGAYIVGLLGDNWNAADNTWANTDNPYYTALSDEVFSSDSATYNQAMEAYYVAYQAYVDQSGAASSGWMDYVNGLLANASITIGELVS